MPTYRVETDRGVFAVETAEPVEENERGQALLQQALEQQLRWRQATSNTTSSFLEQMVGGVRDFGQQMIDQPIDLANAALSYVNPSPPGPGRPAPPYQLRAPVLPDVEAPYSTAEKVVRGGTQLSANAIAALLLPGVRQWASRMIGGPPPNLTPLMFEPGRAAARGGIAGSKPVPTVAAPAGVLTQELPEGAAATARLLGLPDSTAAIARMSLDEALHARGKLSRLLGSDVGQLEELQPLKAVFDAVEQRILSFR